jgi:hypothetical protein
MEDQILRKEEIGSEGKLEEREELVGKRKNQE